VYHKITSHRPSGRAIVFIVERELIELTACEVVELLDKGEIAPEDCLVALEARIERFNGKINALSTLCFERARKHARHLAVKSTHDRGLLRGLPVPIKDLTPVAGVRTTFGSPIYKSYVPGKSDLLVESLENNGAIVYGKTNTPEFGTGGNTFNEVFGVTRNPRDLRLSAGGSSGGAAAALVSGMAWLAHGSDMAGSLRTPASFCGVTSLRPSPGLIAHGPATLPFEVLSQEGAMARTVSDLALLTDAMVGASPLAALGKPKTGYSFADAAAS